ncbi:hypothetical protein [Arthrobacter sp. UYCo732]|uniref:hypothetical protein n=1 Tax=Arthrobacter sp. UYCo732 TaxID=3156336 RepID=UPI0033987BC3
MATKTTEQVLATFGPKQWAGAPAKEAGNLFVGAGFIAFLLCLVLMIFIEPLRDGFVVVLVCTLFAFVAMFADIGSTVRREKAFLVGVTATINELILEMTGDPTAQISVSKFREIVEYEGSLALPVNGVPGLVLRVDGKRLEMKHVLATVTTPEYGLESFDLLLAAEEQGKS